MKNHYLTSYIKRAGAFTFAAGTLILTVVSVFIPLTTLANPLTPPSVATNVATSLQGYSATLNGSVNGNQVYTSAWFEYGTNTSMPYATPKYSYDGNGAANYNYTITDLTPGATYYYRAGAQNAEGITYGDVYSFNTGAVNVNNPNAMIVASNQSAETMNATNISTNSAELNAIIFTSADDTSNTWFEWGTTESLGNQTTPIKIDIFPSIKHIDTLSGLSAGTTYYFRAVVANSTVRNSGTTLYFTTLGKSGTATTVSTSNIVKNTSDTIVKNNTTNISAPASGSALGASAISAGTFFPVTLLGWLFVIILILLLVWLTQKYILRKKQAGALASPQDHA